MERYNFDGREINIIDKTTKSRKYFKIPGIKEKAKVFIKSVIIDYFKNQTFAKNFTKVDILIMNKLKGIHKNDRYALASVDLKDNIAEISIPLAKIYSLYESAHNPNGIINANIEELHKDLLKVIQHELTHIWQKRISDLSYYVKGQSKLIKAIKRKIKNINPKNTKYKIANLRVALFFFSKLIHIEGIAMFNTELNRLPLIGQGIQETYRYAFSSAKEFLNDFNNSIRDIYSKGQDLRYCLSDIPGMIGLHVVYSILIIDKNLTFVDVAKMGPLKFIRKYESCMRIKGMKPIISLKSKEGVIDYNTLLKQVNELYKELIKK